MQQIVGYYHIVPEAEPFPRESLCKSIALPCKGSFGGGGLRCECGFIVIGDFTIIKVHLFRPVYVLIVYNCSTCNNNNNNSAFILISV